MVVYLFYIVYRHIVTFQKAICSTPSCREIACYHANSQGFGIAAPQSTSKSSGEAGAALNGVNICPSHGRNIVHGRCAHRHTISHLACNVLDMCCAGNTCQAPQHNRLLPVSSILLLFRSILNSYQRTLWLGQDVMVALKGQTLPECSSSLIICAILFPPTDTLSFIMRDPLASDCSWP